MKVALSGKTMTAFLSALLVTLAMGPAWGTLLIEANFDVAPNVEDPTWVHSTSWGTEVTLSGGVASYNTIDNGLNVSIFTPVGSMTSAESAVARMRVLDDDGYNGDATSINFIQGGYFFTVGMVSAKPLFHPVAAVVALAGGSPTASYPIDTTVFHNIGLQVTNLATGKYDVYVDGVLALPNNQAFFGGPGFDGQIQFGDNAGTPDADAEMAWVRVYDTPIPEPTVLALLGLGGLFLLRRRRAG